MDKTFLSFKAIYNEAKFILCSCVVSEVSRSIKKNMKKKSLMARKEITVV